MTYLLMFRKINCRGHILVEYAKGFINFFRLKEISSINRRYCYIVQYVDIVICKTR